MNDFARRYARTSSCSRGIRRFGRIILTLAVLGVIPASAAYAHRMTVFATGQGKTIQGEVYYQDGSPAQNVTVSVLDPDGRMLDTATTDGEGRFAYQPRFRGTHKFVADGGFGHRAEHTVAAEELPADLSAISTNGPVAETGPLASPGRTERATGASSHELAAEIRALNQQISALRADLERWKTALRLQDVLGGVGYILGILGGLSYFLAGRRRNKRSPRDA